jgi:hypothetical protein
MTSRNPQKRRRDKKPSEYFRGKADSGYAKAEIQYVLRQCQSARSQEASSADLEAIFLGYCMPLYFFLERIRRGWGHEDSLSQKFFSDTADRYVIRAIKKFGVDSLRLTAQNEEVLKQDNSDYFTKYLQLKDRLATAVVEVIRYWQGLCFSGLAVLRKRGVTQLREVARALTPETRGAKNRLNFGSETIKAYYYRQLFLVDQIAHALKVSNGYRNRSLRVKTVSQAFEMRLETLRELWCLDGEDNPKCRPDTLRDMALLLTDRAFKITKHRLQNILSSPNKSFFP